MQNRAVLSYAYLATYISVSCLYRIPDIKVHGVNTGPIWGGQDPVGPWTLLSGYIEFYDGVVSWSFLERTNDHQDNVHPSLMLYRKPFWQATVVAINICDDIQIRLCFIYKCWRHRAGSNHSISRPVIFPGGIQRLTHWDWYKTTSFADGIFESNFVYEHCRALIEIWLRFVPKGTVNNYPRFVQKMGWRRTDGTILYEPMIA